MKCGLIGAKLSHSYSPMIHGFFGYQYDLIECQADAVAAVLADESYTGFNVTVPYKEHVIQYLDEVDDSVMAIGACNTIVRKNGKLIGFNTDFQGLKGLIEHNKMEINGTKVLVLGSGGTSKTAVAVCRDMGATPVVVSRSGEVNYDSVYEHIDAKYIINTTPHGMSPNVSDGVLIDIARLPNIVGVVDVIFNPMKTGLVHAAKMRGIATASGLLMLVLQGVRAGEIFSGLPSRTPPALIAGRLLNKVTNIVLVGMPGSGKSTIGKALAEKIGMDYVDTDRMIEERVGMTCAEYIEQRGEQAFRDVESDVIIEVGSLRGAVVATGGGAVLRESNRYPLGMNAYVVHVARDIAMLSTHGRPLSQGNDALRAMSDIRLPIYRQVADIEVVNCGMVKDVVADIISRRKI